jgi:WD40 repeat protein
VTGSSDRDVRVWDAATGAPRARLEGDSGVNALAVSPDGGLVAATTSITARTWEIATGSPAVTVKAGYESLTAVAFDHSGTLLGIASTDKTASIWDVATGVPVTTLAGHGSSVTAVAFCPAPGRGPAEAATGSLDGITRIWDALTGRVRVALAGHESRVNAVAYTPSGAVIATGSDRPAVGRRERSAPGYAGPPAVRRVHHAAARRRLQARGRPRRLPVVGGGAEPARASRSERPLP